MHQPKAHGLGVEPGQPSSSPAASPWSSPYRTPQGASPADTPLIASAGHTSLMASPVSSENTFTLLPGYVSRPGPSPLKKPRRASPTRDPGALPSSDQLQMESLGNKHVTKVLCRHAPVCLCMAFNHVL